MDYPASWHHGPCSTLVPYPEEVTNFLAPARPLSSDVISIFFRDSISKCSIQLRSFPLKYQIPLFVFLKVWITLIITVIAALLYFTLVDRNLKGGINGNINAKSSSNGHSFHFVLGNLFSQGICVYFAQKYLISSLVTCIYTNLR